MAKKDKEMLEIEKKARMKQTMESLNSLVVKMENKKAELTEKAKEARRKNSAANFNLAKVGLANAIATQKRAADMLMQLDIMTSMREVSELSKGFLECIGDTCKDINRFAKDNNFAKANKQLQQAYSVVNEQDDKLAMLMESGAMAAEEMNFAFSDEINGEIEALLGDDAAPAGDSLDDEISKKLEKLRRME